MNSLMALLCAAVIGSSFFARAEQVITSDSLKDMARARGGRITVTSDVYLPAPSLAVLASEATVILDGTVALDGAHLTTDETMVLSSYRIVPTRVFKDTAGAVAPKKPALTSGVRFAIPGGRLLVEGLDINYVADLSPDRPLREGERVIVFLVDAPEWKTFRLHFGPYGLLRVTGDKIVAASGYVERVRPIKFPRVSDLVAHIETEVRNSRARRRPWSATPALVQRSSPTCHRPPNSQFAAGFANNLPRVRRHGIPVDFHPALSNHP
jgi:hypothetical protein